MLMEHARVSEARAAPVRAARPAAGRAAGAWDVKLSFGPFPRERRWRSHDPVSATEAEEEEDGDDEDGDEDEEDEEDEVDAASSGLIVLVIAISLSSRRSMLRTGGPCLDQPLPRSGERASGFARSSLLTVWWTIIITRAPLLP
jgi:hypothetical protein